MAAPLNVLILEDRPADAELMAEELRKGGFAPQWRRVDTERDYLDALDPGLDVILSDHSLPQYDSVRALEALNQRGLDVPFIIVSGTICEDLAVALMKQGAADYICKDRMARLGQAVLQARQKKHLREDKRRVEQALRDEQAWFRALTDNIQDCIVVLNASGKVVYSSPSCASIMGYTPETLLGSDGFEKVHPDELPGIHEKFQALLADPGGLVKATVRSCHADGSWRWLDVVAANRLTEAPIYGIILTYRDVTDRMLSEGRLRLQGAALDAAANSIVITDRQGDIVWVNNAFTRLTGYTFAEVRGKNPRVLKSGKQDPAYYKDLWSTISAGTFWHGELINRRKDGNLYTEELTITPVRGTGDEVSHFIAIKQDITVRKQTEAMLRESEQHFRSLFDNMLNGYAYCRMDFVNNCPRDYAFVEVNHAFETLTGLARVTGKRVSEIIPGICELDPELFEILGRVVLTGNSERFEIYLRSLQMWFAIAAYSDDREHFVAIFDVITDRKQAQLALEERARLTALTADVGASLTQEADLHGILQRCTEALVCHLGAAFARIWTLNVAGDTLELQASAGMYTHLDGPHARVPVGQYKIGIIAQERRPYLTNQVRGDPRVHNQEWAQREGMVAFAGHPLVVGGNLRGVMAMFSRQALSENTLDTMANVANQVALGIERKQAENELRASEERFRRITTNMLDLVVQVNPEGLYEYVTPSTLSVLGYRSEDVIGKSFFPLMHPEDLERTITAFKAAMETGAPSFGEYRFRRASGDYIWLEVVGNRLLDDEGKLCGGLIACRDVTARRQAEDEIRKLNAELEQKVFDRTAQLAAANRELESFAYSVSHDLRAPLRGIDGFSQALLEEYHDKLDADGQDYLRRVRAATQRMGRLIDDILQLSRLNRSAMTLAEVDLSAIARRVIAELRAADPARQVEICVKPGLLANGDARLLEVMLTNLIGNAWKFTSKTANARIEFGVCERDHKCAFFVRDNGAGFDMANVDRLFGAFQRLHTEAEFPGTGIGLATVQRVIRRHGGEVWAEGAVGKGATFYFTLGKADNRPSSDGGASTGGHEKASPAASLALGGG